MTRRTLNQATTYREIHAALEHSPRLTSMRANGRHTVYSGPNGCVPVPNHQGDCPNGTRRSIQRMAALAGLAALALAVALLVVL